MGRLLRGWKGRERKGVYMDMVIMGMYNIDLGVWTFEYLWNGPGDITMSIRSRSPVMKTSPGSYRRSLTVKRFWCYYLSACQTLKIYETLHSAIMYNRFSRLLFSPASQLSFRKDILFHPRLRRPFSI